MPLAGLPVPQLLSLYLSLSPSLFPSSFSLLSTLLDFPAYVAALPSKVRGLFGNDDAGFIKAYQQFALKNVLGFSSKGAVDDPVPTTRNLRSQALRPFSLSATNQSKFSSQKARAAPVPARVSPMRSPHSAVHSPSLATPVPLVLNLRPRPHRLTSPSATSINGAGATPGLLFYC